MENRVSITISEEAMANIAAAITTIGQNLPVLINLSKDERETLSKMGDKTLSFVTKALEYAKQNPGVLPTFVDINEFSKDLTAVSTIRQVLIPLKQMVEKLDDTSMLAGTEAYHAARIFYDAVESAARANEPGMENIYNDLKARLPGRSKAKANNKEKG